LGGSEVTMAQEGQLQFVTAVSPDSEELKRSREEHQEGPCRGAYETGEVVRVTDVRQESTRWPHYSAPATRLGLAGVAGIPMRDAGEIIGALNIYSREPREWSGQDIAVAVVLADAATSYVLNAAKLHDWEQLSERLQGGAGVTGRHRTGQGDHRPKEIGHGRSCLPAHAGTPATTTPACARSLRPSLAWDFRFERGGLQEDRPATCRHAP
jgi:hypothetical protein